MIESREISQATLDAMRVLEQGFMTPEIVFCSVIVDSEEGPMPSDDWLINHCPIKDAGRIEEEREAWICRLSASGYMDCTDWMGPFDTEVEAVEALVDACGE